MRKRTLLLFLLIPVITGTSHTTPKDDYEIEDFVIHMIPDLFNTDVLEIDIVISELMHEKNNLEESLVKFDEVIGELEIVNRELETVVRLIEHDTLPNSVDNIGSSIEHKINTRKLNSLINDN